MFDLHIYHIPLSVHILCFRSLPHNTPNAVLYAVPQVYRCVVEYNIMSCCEEQAATMFMVEVSGIGCSRVIRTRREKCGRSDAWEGGTRYRLTWDENGEKET